MLVLTRRLNEQILAGLGVNVKGGLTCISIEARPELKVVREGLLARPRTGRPRTSLRLDGTTEER